MSPERKRLLITGCGRSGTKFMVALLRRHGMDVGHEEMGSDGIAAWTMAVKAPPTRWGPSSRDYSFDQTFHQVRHPLPVIDSTRTFKDESWAYIAEYTSVCIDEPVLIKGAKYWIEWNREAERIATWRYRIEDLPSVYDELCARLALPHRHDVLHRLPRDVNTRRRGKLYHYYDAASVKLGVFRSRRVSRVVAGRASPAPPLDWDDLAALDWRLCRRIRSLARTYGYAV